MTASDIDFDHVRRIADQASACCGMLGAAGETILTVLTILDIAADLPPELAADYAAMVARVHVRLDEAWGAMWDQAGVPRRPLPRVAPTRH